jgi:uncharacterized protein (DUF2147 family)
MPKRSIVIMFLTLLGGSATAAEPIGEWLVEEGSARIRIEPCNDTLWGVISWVREPGYDRQNPDPAKRGRPIVGVPILRNMKPVKPNQWEGEIYNAKNGKMYSASITLVREDALKVEGCVLGGLFCGGETWTRVDVQPNQETAPTPRAKEKQGAKATKRRDVPSTGKGSSAATPQSCYGE